MDKDRARKKSLSEVKGNKSALKGNGPAKRVTSYSSHKTRTSSGPSGKGRAKKAAPRDGAVRRPRKEDPHSVEERYRCLVERSLQGVLIAQGYPPRIVFANDALARMLGYSVEELTRLPAPKVPAIVHPDDRDMFFRRYRDALDGKRVSPRYEFQFIRRDGTGGWMEMFATRIRYRGRPSIQATFIDFTERKEAEERLRLSEEKYRTIVDNIQEGYYEVDLAGNVVFFNEAALEMIGYARDEIIGMNNRRFMDRENARKVYAVFNRVFRTRRAERACDWEIIRRDGTVRTIEASVSPVRGPDGGPAGFRGIMRDITEKRRIERALMESERKYHDVYEIAPLAFVMWDSRCRITDWNRRAEMMFGWRREEVRGMNFLDVLVPDGERPRMEAMVGALLLGEMPCRLVGQNLTRSGAIIACEWNSAVFFDENGSVREVLSLALDVTERTRLEEQLFQSRKMESIGRMAGGIAHDLNNLLTPVLGYADMLLLDAPMDDDNLDRMIQVKESAERARDLTRQLLAFSRKQVLRMRVMPLEEVVRGFEKILRRTIREDISLAVSVRPGSGNIMTDPSQVEQILLNLAVNSQEAMQSGGSIAIEVSNVVLDEAFARDHQDARPGPHVRLSFSDTGCGMDDDTMEHMFEPFFTTRETGTGLGLATVYGIVRQHNGSIVVSSRPGGGTTIRIYFPAAEGEVEEPVPEARPLTFASHGGTILVVEDEEAVRILAGRILAKAGYRVFSASCADEALRIVEEHGDEIQLLLTDIIMPKMDGKTLYRTIAGIRSGIRVLYMSGYTRDVIAHHGVVEEGAHFIQKPFTFQALADKVCEVLGS